MRNANEIPKSEFQERLEKQRKFFQDPYRKALQNRQQEIFGNPKNVDLSSGTGKASLELKSDYKKQWDDIGKELKLYHRHLYPELSFRIEDDDKLNEVKKLKADEFYNTLVKGLKYFSEEIDDDDDAISEIIGLNKQISVLIDEKFPKLFDK